MHSLVSASDVWVLQEDVMYDFQYTDGTKSLPHLRQHCSRNRYERRPSSGPEIVLLSLWSQATAQQILHYTAGYEALYPSARVLQLHNTATNFRCNDETQISALDKLLETQSSSDHPTVLLHLFGTSGAAGACKLLRNYRLRTGGLLNVKAVIADTEPSSLLTTYLSSTEPLTSAVFTILLAFWIALQRCVWSLAPDIHAGQIHRDLNNPLLLPKEARKCFVFAQSGLMLTWMRRTLPARARTSGACSGEVDDEADERRQCTIRRSSIDQKGRWSGDQECYWSGIESVWEGR